MIFSWLVFRAVFFILLFCGVMTLRAQVVSTANLDLFPAGSFVHDVVYDPYHDCYIVVGKFDSVNGISRKNIAFLNAADLSVNTATYLAPLTNIDGEIRTVELTKTSSGFVDTYHLYLGGNFNTVISGGVHTRKGIVKFTGTKTWVLPSPTYTNFVISSWNADLDMTSGLAGFYAEGVDDILITNDTVIFSGRFYAVNNSTTYDLRDGVAAYKLNGTLLAYPSFASTGAYIGSRYFVLHKTGSNLYTGGYINGGTGYDGRLFKLNAAGAVLPSFLYDNGNLKAVLGISSIDDSLLLVTDDRNALNSQADGMHVWRKSNGTEKLNHSFTPQSGYIGGVVNPASHAVYKHYVYTSNAHVGYSVVSYENTPGTTPVAGVDWNAAATHSLNVNLYGHVHAVGSHLFVSGSNLATLSGFPHVRFGAYCLEPHNAVFFTDSDSTVCPEQWATYTIPGVPFADGYRWEYSGSGADFNEDGNADAWIELGDTGNTIDVFYTTTFAPGQIKVTPFAKCVGSSPENVYSNTIVTNIISNPLPHINAGADTLLTCAVDTILLHGYSDSAVVSYEWLDGMAPYPQGQDTLVTQPGAYIFKVTDVLGCPNYDTVQVLQNIMQPVVVAPTGTYDLTCAQPVKNFLGTSPSPNTTAQWYDPFADSFSSNPVAVSVPGPYRFIVTDTLNGCKDSLDILVELNTPQPNIAVVGYPLYNPAQPLDTLTCFTPVLNLTCASDTANTTVTWTSADTSLVFGTAIAISAPGNYYIFVTNNVNGCTNFAGVNINSYMAGPLLEDVPDSHLNCSIDSLILDGSSMSAGTQLEWTGLSIPSSANPLTVHDPGTYYLTAINPETGCATVDSVVVSEDNSIDVFAGNDVLACDQEAVVLTANYTGTIGGISYLWNTGSVAASENYSVGNSVYAAVEVFGDNGCYGADTVYLDLPPVAVVNFEGFKPCDDGPSGQIVATPVSGTAPFQYSIDNGSVYQSSPVFTGLFMGTYPVVVKDSLGCEYPFTAVIDANSVLPEPAFLFSTYNMASDTVVVVDISNPPADSVNWIFPPGLSVLDDNPLSPVILLPDTGAFEIVMEAWYGNCLVELSKMIYASPFDSLAANHYNANGIKSIELYPNPTTGIFTVSVEFYKSQRAALVVQDMPGNTYVFEAYSESILISEEISLDDAILNGTYVLKIVSEYDSATLTFILAR